MDRNSRIILAVLVIGLTALRLIRYVQIATAKRRISAIPSTSVAIPTQPTAADTNPVSAATGGFVQRGVGLLAAVVSWVVGNALIWTVLFGFQYLDGIPVFVRLFAGVLASLYLIQLSRHIAKRVTTNRGSAESTSSPFG
jgi:hypothetical protein